MKSIGKKVFITSGIAASAFVLLLLFLFNPTEVILVPKCSFHELTGLNCPGCGMQRFLHALMHGHFSEAIHYNYLLIIILPYIVLFAIEELLLTGKSQQRWRNILTSKWILYALCFLAPAWFIARNLLHI